MSATKATRAKAAAPEREVIPLGQRPWDILYIVFFLVNIFIITYIVDIEQLTIPEPWPVMKQDSDYPIWPPRWWVDTIHNYGRTYDPLLLARPVWWKVTIWYDSLLFGPLYFIFTYAFYKGREWVRIPAIIYGSVITTIVTTICSEEIWGPHAAHNTPMVLALNGPWFLLPLAMIFRFWLVEHPFTREVTKGRKD